MDVTLLEVTSEHAALIERWLHAEHVRRYWGDPAQTGRALDALPPETRRAIIEVGGREVGLAIWQCPTRRELDAAGLHDIPETVTDIDILIGEPDAVGRGIGSAALRLIADGALENPGVPFVIAAAAVENAASRRAFAKAGFVEDREFDDVPDGHYVLLVRRRTGLGGIPVREP